MEMSKGQTTRALFAFFFIKRKLFSEVSDYGFLTEVFSLKVGCFRLEIEILLCKEATKVRSVYERDTSDETLYPCVMQWIQKGE